MENEGGRYKSYGEVLWQYRNEFLVVCPKCGKDAVISTKDNMLENAKLTCSHCLFIETSTNLLRYKTVVKRNCDTCGKSINIEITQKEPGDKITVPCPHCTTIRTYPFRNETYHCKYKSTGYASDPLFNLPLWLQIEVKGHWLWAYNRRHLHDIKTYVQAKLRERQSKGYTTMVERLPQFIKEAKNREAVLKGIEQMEQRFTK